jgi:hypothetical protein
MNKARQDGLYLLLMGAVVFLLIGIAMENASATSLLDFKAVYYGARCVIGHADPYREGEILRAYQADGGQFPTDPIQSRVVHQAVAICVNLPTTLFILAPFAFLSLGGAQVLWTAITAGSLVVAALLVWDLGADFAPVLAGALAGLLLANSEMLLMVGNTAGIVVALCVGAVWCFVRGRLAPLGIPMLAIALAIKPHDAGLVWFYFLLAGGVYRKRALQALLTATVLALPGVLWVAHVSPNWMQELHANLAVTSAAGGLNDPGMAASGAHAVGMPIHLQSALSAFRDDPRFYHPASYLICIVPLSVWAWVTLRFRSSQARTYLALAAIAAVTLLPVYHRPYDARLLLLTIPACALLWSEGGVAGRAALWLSAAGFVLTGDPWAILLGMVGNSQLAAGAGAGRLLTAIQVFPAPAILLAVGVFYCWVYARRDSAAEPQLHRPKAQ